MTFHSLDLADINISDDSDFHGLENGEEPFEEGKLKLVLTLRGTYESKAFVSINIGWEQCLNCRLR